MKNDKTMKFESIKNKYKVHPKHYALYNNLLQRKEEFNAQKERAILSLKDRYPDVTDNILKRAGSVSATQYVDRSGYDMMICDYLDSINVKYILQYPILTDTSFIVSDIFIPNYNIIIEVDDSLHEKFGNKEKDIARDMYVSEKYNYKTTRIKHIMIVKNWLQVEFHLDNIFNNRKMPYDIYNVGCGFIFPIIKDGIIHNWSKFYKYKAQCNNEYKLYLKSLSKEDRLIVSQSIE